MYLAGYCNAEDCPEKNNQLASQESIHGRGLELNEISTYVVLRKINKKCRYVIVTMIK
jgi:hypothetical protein